MLDQLEVSSRVTQLASNVMAMMATLPESFQLEKPRTATRLLMTCAVSRMLESIPYRRTDEHAIERKHCTCCYPVLPAVQQAKKEEEVSAWEPNSPRDVSRCKALLLEVLRRAAHDWVLYRQHKRMQLRVLADDAYLSLR